MVTRGSEGNPLFCERLMDQLSDKHIIEVLNDENGEATVVVMHPEQMQWVHIEQVSKLDFLLFIL
jgi:hypothetical protein